MENEKCAFLGNEKIWKLVLKIAIPSMLAQFVNVLYSIVDRIYLSHLEGVGQTALAAIGVCGPIVTFISSFAFWVGLGGAPIFSIRLGEKNQAAAKKVLSNCLMLLSILSVVLMIIVFIFYEPMLRAFGASEELFALAKDYLIIYNVGTIFAILSVGLNCFIISQGFSSIGMTTVIIGAVTNIALDPLFIFVFNMGVKGAALATVISQALSCAFVIWFLTSRRTEIKLSFGNYSNRIMLKVLLLGLSPFVIISTDSVLLIALNSVLQKYGGSQGDILIASATIMLSFMQIITAPLGGITGGTQPILSYNYGAKNSRRVKSSEFYICLMCLIYTTIMFIAANLGGKSFARIFTTDTELIKRSSTYLKIFTLCIIPLSFQYTFVDGLTALGIAPVAITLSLIRKLTMFVLMVFVLPRIYYIEKVFYAQPIADLVSAIISTIVYFSCINHILKKRELTRVDLGYQ